MSKITSFKSLCPADTQTNKHTHTHTRTRPIALKWSVINNFSKLFKWDEGRGQNILSGGYSSESWRVRQREPIVGVWGISSSGVGPLVTRVQANFMGAKLPLKLKAI